MNEVHEEDERSYLISRNRFVILIIGTTLVSLGLVIVAMALYASSGAAQVDLSRPGYKEVRSQTREEDPSFDGFSASGPIDEEALAKFEKLFEERTKSVVETKVFNSDVLSDEALRINAN